MNFKISKDYYCSNIKMYEKSSVEIKPGLTILVGCNGAGKTTLIQQLKEKCEEFDIPNLSYDQRGLQSSSILMDKMLNLDGDISGLVNMYASSEGQRIRESIYYFGRDYQRFLKTVKKHQNHLFFFFDALDSGLSVDNIIEFKYDCVEPIIETCNKANKEAYIIVPCNEYEMARGENCLILPDLIYREIKNYDACRKIILRSRRKNDKAYGYEEFNYE
jgi:hypothetical protein